MSEKKRVLTGITTSGIPHIGNLAGAILPAIKASKDELTDSFLFLADYHSLIKNNDPDLTHTSSFFAKPCFLDFLNLLMSIDGFTLNTVLSFLPFLACLRMAPIPLVINPIIFFHFPERLI